MSDCGCPDACMMDHYYCRCDDIFHLALHMPETRNDKTTSLTIDVTRLAKSYNLDLDYAVYETSESKLTLVGRKLK